MRVYKCLRKVSPLSGSFSRWDTFISSQLGDAPNHPRCSQTSSRCLEPNPSGEAWLVQEKGGHRACLCASSDLAGNFGSCFLPLTHLKLAWFYARHCETLSPHGELCSCFAWMHMWGFTLISVKSFLLVLAQASNCQIIFGFCHPTYLLLLLGSGKLYIWTICSYVLICMYWKEKLLFTVKTAYL